MESLLPIYEFAEQLDKEHPEYRHVVTHIYPIATDKNVCGLHRIENLRIVRSKISNEGGYYLTGPH